MSYLPNTRNWSHNCQHAFCYFEFLCNFYIFSSHLSNIPQAPEIFWIIALCTDTINLQTSSPGKYGGFIFFYFPDIARASGFLFLFIWDDWEGIGGFWGVDMGVWLGSFLKGEGRGHGMFYTDAFCFVGVFVSELGGGGSKYISMRQVNN